MLRYLLGLLLITSVIISTQGCTPDEVKPTAGAKSLFPPREKDEKQSNSKTTGI